MAISVSVFKHWNFFSENIDMDICKLQIFALLPTYSKSGNVVAQSAGLFNKVVQNQLSWQLLVRVTWDLVPKN